MKILALLTDFGYEDPYVGSMKAKIYQISSEKDIKIIDAIHNIKKHSIYEAAYWINYIYKDYPEETLFLCVIDPTVGTERKALFVEFDKRYFIGPDNGIFTLLIRKGARVYLLPPPPEKASPTFHGRDYFSVWAAKFLVSPFIRKIFKPLSNPYILNLPEPVMKEEKILGNAVISDRFGNILTDIPNEWIKGKGILKIKNFEIKGPRRTYADAPKGELLFLKGSFGYLEIGANMESAFDIIKPEFPEKIEIFINKNLK